MSKGLGQKIAIKFTEDLVGDVSGKGITTPYSFYRWYITSTWSSSGRLYLYELEFFSNGTKVNTNKIISMAGSSRYSSSYDVDKLFDGSVPGREWDANGSLPHWVSIELDEAIIIDSFRWHTGTSGNKPKEFILQGSNDGINWVDIYMDESPNLNNWIDFVVNVGNEIAFTVTGKEYQYVNGPLIDKEYQVEKVERYPVQRLWELGGQLQLDGPGEMSITDAQCYTGSGITSLTGTVYAHAGDIVLATATHRGVFTPPDGWEFLYESPTIGTVNHRMIVFKKYVDESGLVSFTGKQNISQSMYLNLISISGISDIVFAPELESIYRGGVKPAPMPDKQEGEKIIWGATVSLYATSPPYGGWSTTPDDLTIIHLDQASYAPRLANLIDFGNGQPNNRTIMQSPSTTGTDVNIAGFKVIQNYSTPKIYTSQAIQLDGEYKLRWIENKPESTDILIEYTTGETQGQWQTVSNGEVINVDTNLWIKITLSTEDETVTPTIEDLWIEEPDAPNDIIRLVMHPQGRFNNVEGPLTVQYDQSKGSLRGRGGPVEGFTETFTPTDLEPKPNPHVAENIEVSAEANVNFTKVIYDQGYADEHLTVSATATVDFIYVGIINP